MDEIIVQLQNQLGNFSLDVDFTIPASGITALFGASGSGKTSILRSIAGLETPDLGFIRFKNETWQAPKQFTPAHKRPIGYVFQEASLFPHLSVKKNLEYGLKRTAKSEQKIDCQQVIEIMGIEPLLQHQPHQLSGGERQRIAIARALLTSPKLMLMDEPLSALDHGNKQKILPYLEQLHNSFDIPSIYVSHDPDEIARIADQMLLLDQGKVIAQGNTSDLLTRLDLPMAQFDNATAMLQGIIETHDQEKRITWVKTNSDRIAIPGKQLSPGKAARLQIHARDVSLALNKHTDTSILNILPVTIVDIRQINEGQVLVKLALGDQQVLLSRITVCSAQTLGLEKGKELFGQVKAIALKE